MVKFICDCCGKEFYSEHWTGGYIDHMNMVNNRRIYKSRFKSNWYNEIDEVNYKKMIEDVVNEICYCGNDPREEYDVKSRLECFMLWDDFSENEKTEVKTMVETLIFARDQAYKKLEKYLKSLTNTELNVLEGIQLNLYYK